MQDFYYTGKEVVLSHFQTEKIILKQLHFHSCYLVMYNVHNPLVLIAVNWTSTNLQIIPWPLLGILNCRGLVLTWRDDSSAILRMLDVCSITILWVLTAFHIESYTIHLLWSGAFYEALTKKQPLCCFHQPYCCKSIYWTCSNPLLEKKSFNTKACNILT